MKLTRQTIAISIAVPVVIIGLILAYFYLLKPYFDKKLFPADKITVSGELNIPSKYELKGKTVAITLESNGTKKTELILPGKFSIEYPGNFSYRNNLKLTAVYKLQSKSTNNLFDRRIEKNMVVANKLIHQNLNLEKPANDYSVDLVLSRNGKKIAGNGNVYQAVVGDAFDYKFEWFGTLAKWLKPSFSAEAKCVKSIPTDSVEITKNKIDVKKEGFVLLDCYSGKFKNDVVFGQPKVVKIISTNQ